MIGNAAVVGSNGAWKFGNQNQKPNSSCPCDLTFAVAANSCAQFHLNEDSKQSVSVFSFQFHRFRFHSIWHMASTVCTV